MINIRNLEIGEVERVRVYSRAGFLYQLRKNSLIVIFWGDFIFACWQGKIDAITKFGVG